jgi:hypothetical protein
MQFEPARHVNWSCPQILSLYRALCRALCRAFVEFRPIFDKVTDKVTDKGSGFWDKLYIEGIKCIQVILFARGLRMYHQRHFNWRKAPIKVNQKQQQPQKQGS